MGAASPLIAHGLKKDEKNHDYNLEQKKLDQASRRAGDVDFLDLLKNHQCGFIGDPEEYKNYCNEVFNRHPQAKIIHGHVAEKCYEEAILKRR